MDGENNEKPPTRKIIDFLGGFLNKTYIISRRDGQEAPCSTEFASHPFGRYGEVNKKNGNRNSEVGVFWKDIYIYRYIYIFFVVHHFAVFLLT